MIKIHLILDSNYMLHRMLNVPTFSELRNSHGVGTGAVYGVLKSLRATLSRFGLVDKITAVFDSKHSARRKLIHPEYKGNRSSRASEVTDEERAYRESFYVQKLYVSFIIRKLGGRVLEVKDREADDVIYWLTRNTEGRKVVMSDDRDMYQMIDDQTILYRPMAEEVVNLGNFEESYGVPPDKFLLYRALVGDTSDCIYGINGVGDVTAKDIVKNSHDVESVVVYCKSTGKKRWLAVCEQTDIVKRNLSLLDLSLEEFDEDMQKYMKEVMEADVGLDINKVLFFFQKMEFRSFMGKNQDDFFRFVAPFHIMR